MWFRLVERDRWLLALLGEHKVLTTNQIAAVAFTSVRRAQDRLRTLRQLGVVFAFRESSTGGGTSQTRYALGYLGARLIAAQRAQTPPRPQAHQQRLERLGVWPKLGPTSASTAFSATSPATPAATLAPSAVAMGWAG